MSGEEIPFERLEAMPTATTCIQHATNKLNMNTRPVEEEVLSPSFHKHDEDRSVEYDAEDAWQDVANYGTSETPSDLERQDSKNYNGMYVNSEENVGYVEDFENFIGTDMYGKIRKFSLRKNMKNMSKCLMTLKSVPLRANYLQTSRVPKKKAFRKSECFLSLAN